MLNLLIRLVVNAIAIWVAAGVIPGMSLTDEPLGVVLVVIVFAVINAVLKPLAVLIGFPLIVVTLGLFTLVINAGLLGLTAGLTDALELTGFWPAVGGALVISVVSWFFGAFLGADTD